MFSDTDLMEVYIPPMTLTTARVPSQTFSAGTLSYGRQLFSTVPSCTARLCNIQSHFQSHSVSAADIREVIEKAQTPNVTDRGGDPKALIDGDSWLQFKPAGTTLEKRQSGGEASIASANLGENNHSCSIGGGTIDTAAVKQSRSVNVDSACDPADSRIFELYEKINEDLALQADVQLKLRDSLLKEKDKKKYWYSLVIGM
jgi:hypothetical protein